MRKDATLQRDWYRLLEAEGFDMSDMLRRHDGSFEDDGTQYGRRSDHVSIDALGESELADVESVDLWSLGAAEQWRGIGHAAHALPLNYVGRALLIAWSDSGNLVESARAHGVSRWVARRTVEAFMARVQLEGVQELATRILEVR